MDNCEGPDLILLTDHYPFENYEPFIKNEVNVIWKSFRRIRVFSFSGEKNVSIAIPPNLQAERISKNITIWDKILAIRFLFKKEILNELFLVLTNKHLSKIPAIKEIGHMTIRADKISRILAKKLFTNNPLQKNQKLIFYAYWTDRRTLACILLKRRFPWIKIISRAHGWDVYFYRHPSNYLPFRKLFSQQLDAFIFISKGGLRYTQEILKDFNNKHMICCPLGVEKIIDSPNRASSKIFRIYSCSSLTSLKRVHLIIEALSLIDTFEIEWEHYGKGPLDEALAILAQQKLGSHKNITYRFNGYIANEKIIDVLLRGQFHFLINVSETEGIPVTMMEAMAMGIPVIGTDVGSVNEILRHKNNGFLLNQDSTPLQIAEVIRAAKNLNQSEYQQMQANAWNTWEQKYNAEINYSSFATQLTALTA